MERLSLHMNQIAGLAYCQANGGTGELPTEDNGDGGPLARCTNLIVVSLFTNKVRGGAWGGALAGTIVSPCSPVPL